MVGNCAASRTSGPSIFSSRTLLAVVRVDTSTEARADDEGRSSAMVIEPVGPRAKATVKCSTVNATHECAESIVHVPGPGSWSAIESPIAARRFPLHILLQVTRTCQPGRHWVK